MPKRKMDRCHDFSAAEVVGQYDGYYRRGRRGFLRDEARDRRAYAGLADHFLSLTGLSRKRGGRVLDLGCGVGGVSLELAARGFSCVGVDLCPTAIEIATALAAKRGLAVDWRQADFREMDWCGEFDLVLYWDVTFGIFPPAENRDLLQRMARSLKPGGRLLIEAYCQETALERGVEGVFFHDPATGLFLPRARRGNRIPALHLLSRGEWRDWARQAGLTVAGWDGWGDPDDPPGAPWVAQYIILRKPVRRFGKGAKPKPAVARRDRPPDRGGSGGRRRVAGREERRPQCTVREPSAPRARSPSSSRS